jgi:hypothetical protein
MLQDCYGLYEDGRMESEYKYSALSPQETEQHGEWTQQLHYDAA